MAAFSCKTRKGSSKEGKPRVFFACHPEDFALFFEKISEEILKIHDCVIYYAEDPDADLEEEYLETDLGRMNLFVVPVTTRLLTTPNRAMELEIPFAKGANIPILPLLMEKVSEELYAASENFENLQYLDVFSSDPTQISYELKLKKYLESVLVSDETAKRIRAAFDAYVFLSYRKKDRNFANELMKLIHQNPECRDLAIWFDEFLTPGESFMSGIEKALKNSKLFVLLVTPNVLLDVDGKPNFVMGQEYPNAKKCGKEIFPVEMQGTDRALLNEKFSGLPDCVSPKEEVLFRKRLLETVKRLAITPVSHDTEHNFLIGLAYLEGLDVETNRLLGFELVEEAANAGLPEAIRRLTVMFSKGIFVPKSIKKAIEWGEKLLLCQQAETERVRDLLFLAELYCEDFQYQTAILLYRKAEEGNVDLETGMRTLNGLANAYRFLDRIEAAKIREQVYSLCVGAYGSDHENTLRTAFALAVDSFEAGDPRRAVGLLEEYRSCILKGEGEETLNTLAAMEQMARCYAALGDFSQAKKNLETVLKTRKSAFSEDAKSIVSVLRSLSALCLKTGDAKKALEYALEGYRIDPREIQRVFDWYQACKTEEELIGFLKKEKAENLRKRGKVGEVGITLRRKLISLYQASKQYEMAIGEMKELYEALYRGEENGAVCADLLLEISHLYRLLKNEAKAQYYKEKSAVSSVIAFYDYDPFRDPVSSLSKLNQTNGDARLTLEAAEQEYLSHRGVVEVEWVRLLKDLSYGYQKAGDEPKAKQYFEGWIRLQKRYLEEDHPQLIRSLENRSKWEKERSSAQEKDAERALIRKIEGLYEAKCQTFGETGREALEQLQFLAKTYAQFGFFSEAATRLQKAHDLAVKVMGEDYLISLNFYTDLILATLTEYLLKANEAEKGLETAKARYDFNRKYRGESSAEAVGALKELAAIHQGMGAIEKAAELSAKADSLSGKSARP